MDTVDRFVALIPETLLDMSGSAFSQGRRAFNNPSGLYFLGLNPAGDPSWRRTVRMNVEAVLHGRRTGRRGEMSHGAASLRVATIVSSVSFTSWTRWGWTPEPCRAARSYSAGRPIRQAGHGLPGPTVLALSRSSHRDAGRPSGRMHGRAGPDDTSDTDSTLIARSRSTWRTTGVDGRAEPTRTPTVWP